MVERKQGNGRGGGYYPENCYLKGDGHGVGDGHVFRRTGAIDSFMYGDTACWGDGEGLGGYSREGRNFGAGDFY